MSIRTCPRCGTNTNARDCCGVVLSTPFRMTASMVTAVRRFAHGAKGLDEDTYRLHLKAVGVSSTLHLNRDQYHALLARLRKLPSAPGRRPRAAAC